MLTKQPTTLLLLLSFTFIACGPSFSQDKNQKFDRPNIIYILADDLGYGDVKSFNQKDKIATPNPDTMAANGIKFTDAHSSSEVWYPTPYGILTGRYNWRSSLKSFVLSGYSKSLIKDDIGESKNRIENNPTKALKNIIMDGRSTPSTKHKNDGMEGWKQIEGIVTK
ncbi:Sulfatase [Zobellia uliginosa]|uniref:Sulfatase n=1 Tax=Zobellia uliginosa TaxID=143224 RepID=A0ABY1KVE5_9FLAO|nr:sulfatase-like hydrolase/transferase [Zobellia uliginosa]SIS83090.1 Sulfatase [Zobellia uliginosa]